MPGLLTQFMTPQDMRMRDAAKRGGPLPFVPPRVVPPVDVSAQEMSVMTELVRRMQRRRRGGVASVLAGMMRRG